MRTLLSLTLSGSSLALVLLALRYVLLKKLPSSVYYYAWLLVLLRFVLPLPGLVPAARPAAPAPTPAALVRPAVNAAPISQAPAQLPHAAGPVAEATPLPTSRPADLQTAPAQGNNDVNHKLSAPDLVLRLWAAGTALRLLIYVVSYKLFTLRVRRSLSSAARSDRRVYAALPGRKPKLYRCAAFETPLQFGVFRPVITLPERAYDEELLLNILRHELMHYRRRDTLYKWFAVAVLSTQWFNPLAYLIRRELNRACELSCDEMLLRRMDRAQMRSYGNTLLNMAASGALPAGVVATTFSTEKKNLKERLEQIMNYKKSGSRMLASVLALALLMACALGFGPAAAVAASQDTDVVRVSTVDELLAAIGPNRVIELAPGVYDLSTASNYGEDSHSAHYSWNGANDGFELVLQNVEGLSIRGAGMGETILTAVPRYANVLRFIGCRDISLSGLTAGHTTEPGFCMGGVLYFENSDRVTIEGCGLYGCGTIGVWARDCNELTVTASDIYECSYGALNVHQCRNVRMEDCDIHDHGTREGQGAAMSLFDAAYSEGVVLYKNRVHDNRAQYLLNASYTKGALFLSNDVTGNSFEGAVFTLQQYGATVDGCRFEGNLMLGGWYNGNGVYPANINGDPLEGAELAEMVLRDIDPETASPIVSIAGAMEIPAGASVEVKTVDEFLAAIGPDRTVVLDGELFDLSAASNYGGIGTEYYYWMESYDGPQLVIHDVSGLSIRAKDTSSGATTLAAIPRYADVLSFRNCENLFLGGFTAGHTKEPGSCSGGVLNFQSCHQITVEKMRLYGCGILGIQTSQCTSLNILRTEIYECSQGAGTFFQTDGIHFVDCDIHDVPSPALIFNECGDKIWNNEPFTGLNGTYDVDADGQLLPYSNRGDVDVLTVQEGEWAYNFLRGVQRNIARSDWETLANRMVFPLTIILPGSDDITFAHIPDREAFLALDLDAILDEDYRQYVENARIGECYEVSWGYTALDESLCFAAYPEGEIKVTALILSESRLAGDARGLELLAPYIASGVPENPFDNVPPTPFEAGTPQLEFAAAVQREIADRNWAALGTKIAYPLQVFTADGSYLIESMAVFLANADDFMTPEFCALIEASPLDVYGYSPFGSTFCSHRLSFACFTDEMRTMDDLHIPCISTAQPLYTGGYVQAVPPTPQPDAAETGLGVLFYETEIRDEFTTWAGDGIDLRVQVPPELLGELPVEWSTNNPAILQIEPLDAISARIVCLDDGSLPASCKLSVSCAGLRKELTVHCRTERSSPSAAA